MLLKQMAGGHGTVNISIRDGAFAADVPPGQYEVIVGGNGFFFPHRKLVPTLSLSPGDRQRFRLDVLPTATISGRVSDQDGRPLASVRVNVLHNDYADGVHVLNSVGAGVFTNAQGGYRIENIPPGEYAIRATLIAAANLPRASLLTMQSVASMYYPGVLSPEEATMVRLEPGKELSDTNFRLRQGSAFSVQVRLSPSPVQLQFVSMYAVRRGPHGISGVDGDQTESLGADTYRIPRLPPGTYDVLGIVNRSFADAEPLTARFSIKVTDSDVDAGSVAVHAGTPISGRLSAANPLVPIDPRGIRVTLRPIDSAPPSFARTSAPADGNGTFKVPGVISGHFQINVANLPPGSYVRSAFYKGRNVLDEGIRIESESPDSLEVFISQPAGTVEGVVTGAGVLSTGSTIVVLAPAPDKRLNHDGFRSILTDTRGNFSIRDVPPGDYDVFAWEDMEPGAYTDPEFLDRYKSHALRLTLTPGSRSAISLRSIQ